MLNDPYDTFVTAHCRVIPKQSAGTRESKPGEEIKAFNWESIVFFPRIGLAAARRCKVTGNYLPRPTAARAVRRVYRTYKPGYNRTTDFVIY